MDMFWTVVLVVAFMTGIMGWVATPVFASAIYLFCNWREGVDINWGLEVAFMIAVPFAWIFFILEVVIVYMT